MALENATYINQLVVTNPDGLDPKSQGDDHLRLLKRTIKQTFPNITGPVTVTQAQLNAVGAAGVLVPTGTIVMWGGNTANIPAGWKLCNGQGQLSNGWNVPNLLDRFIVAAGASYGVGAVGGAVTHAHSVSVAGTALSIEQIPPHSHQVGVGPYTPTNRDTVGADIEPRNVMHWPGTYANWNSSPAGSGQAHSHGASSGAADSRPPFYALAFIIKD